MQLFRSAKHVTTFLRDNRWTAIYTIGIEQRDKPCISLRYFSLLWVDLKFRTIRENAFDSKWALITILTIDRELDEMSFFH